LKEQSMSERTHQKAGAGRRLAALLGLCAFLALAGCGKGDLKLVPVEGTVTVGGKTLTSGVVTYWLEGEAEGSKKVAPIGNIGTDGTYKMTTNGKDGAPVGRYKVTVSTMMPPGSDVPDATGGGKKPTPPKEANPAVKIDSRYISPKTTTLKVEVSENPSSGAYDLKLER
jgi:hypothetical protein